MLNLEYICLNNNTSIFTYIYNYIKLYSAMQNGACQIKLDYIFGLSLNSCIVIVLLLLLLFWKLWS